MKKTRKCLYCETRISSSNSICSTCNFIKMSAIELQRYLNNFLDYKNIKKIVSVDVQIIDKRKRDKEVIDSIIKTFGGKKLTKPKK